jgi:glutathione S-transferase
MHLFDYLDSGNGYKVRLLLAQLGLDYRWTEVDIDAGKTRTPEFLKRNLNGRIPTLELDDGTNLAESNAILWYLAEGTAFVPGDRLGRAQALQWMFFEQYSHEPFVATPRYIVKHLPPEHARRAELPERLAKGCAALAVMDEHLKSRRFFAAERYTIADIALYAYTHVAHEGGHDLGPYAGVRAWIARVVAEPRHIGIYARPSPGAARVD